MPRKALKKYESYLFDIKTFAKALKIKLEWKSTSSDGEYLPSKRKIKIDPDMSEADTISTLLHELGHVLDEMSLDEKTANKIGKSYGVIYTDCYSTKDVDIVAAAEIRAWNYGRAIGKNLGIRIGKWYDLAARQAIRDYKKL